MLDSIGARTSMKEANGNAASSPDLKANRHSPMMTIRSIMITSATSCPRSLLYVSDGPHAAKRPS